MITLEGRVRRFCGGVTRRDVLRVGSLGIAGFALADLLRLGAEASPTRGGADSILMIHLSGGPSHLDTYDPKPDAPAEIRGEFKAIPTNVDGIRIAEHFPLQAKRMDRLALVRSVHGGPNEHSSSHTVTGYSNAERRVQERPSIGSVVALEKDDRKLAVPPYVTLDYPSRFSGLGTGYLSPAYAPLALNDRGGGDLRLRLDRDRFETRRQLLKKLDTWRREVESTDVDALDTYSRRALGLLSSGATYDALDLSKEDEATRKRYGNDQFLLARRLIEAGVKCVALSYGGWDTHSNNFNSLKGTMTRLDQAFTSLLDDLQARGLYDRTLVVMWGEFGRTPRVNRNAGRDHWPDVMSAVVAGGGLKMGQVVGASDPLGGEPVEDPCSIRSVVATLYHALGIDPAAELEDQGGRPFPLIHDAKPIRQLTG